MKKSDLITSLLNDARSRNICTELVDAVFAKLATTVSLDESLTIEGIGHFGAHLRRGANKELPNEEGVLTQNNLSIFFHPAVEIQEQVREHVEET